MTRQAEGLKAHRAKIKALLSQPTFADFYDEITSARMQLISRHLNLLSRQMMTDGPQTIPPEIFERVERVPDLMAG